MTQERVAFVMDVEFVSRKKKAALRLTLKEKGSNVSFRAYDEEFEPYFFLKLKDGIAKTDGELDALVRKILDVKIVDRGEVIQVKRVEKTSRAWRFEPLALLKVVAHHPGHVPRLSKELEVLGQPFENNIPWYKRYLIDKKLTPTALATVVTDGMLLKTITPAEGHDVLPLNAMAVDIETYNQRGQPDATKDPALMVGCAWRPHPYSTDPAERKKMEGIVLTHSKTFSDQTQITHTSNVSPTAEKFVKRFNTEREMLESVAPFIAEHHADVIATYNGDQFDLPYLATRAGVLKAHFSLGRDGKPPKTKQAGIRKVSTIAGRIHFDVFPTITFLNFIGAIKVPRLTLERVAQEILGKKKGDVDRANIWKLWDAPGTQGRDELTQYCKMDAELCLDLLDYCAPLQIAMSRTTGLTLFDTIRATASQFVEMRLLRAAKARGELAPNTPGPDESKRRGGNPIQGAFVKTPAPGIYENIAVLDFKSLYPSIIISHNIDPGTYLAPGEPTPMDPKTGKPVEVFTSPQGHRFRADKRGIIPETLENILNERIGVQSGMKKLLAKPGMTKDSDEYKALYARQWSLKILMNSFYGYLGYARARWYSREAAESTTAWAREYISNTIQMAENAGFSVLYSDTDSTFLQYPKGQDHTVVEFQKKVNDTLPKNMALELEDFYPRGIFVAKKQLSAKKTKTKTLAHAQAQADTLAAGGTPLADEGEKSTGAKKKYALIDREGRIKIRGFELVRRDWSPIARKTQKRVLELLLKDGDVQAAVAEVKSTVEKLRSGTVPLEDVTVLTALKKRPEHYDIISPEVAAVKKANKTLITKGQAIQPFQTFGFIITNTGKTISEKATVAEFVKPGDYDADYYIEHQLLPAILKILSELGVKEEDLLTNTKQKGLAGW